MADDPILGDLVPVAPEELLLRGALGFPGRLRIEVGLSEPRFVRPQGRRTAREVLALQRALGGVSYPADRERVISEAGRWLGGHDGLRERLLGLPELTYGGEMEVLRKLSEPTAEALDPPLEAISDQSEAAAPPSAGSGNQDGSSASW